MASNNEDVFNLFDDEQEDTENDETQEDDGFPNYQNNDSLTNERNGQEHDEPLYENAPVTIDQCLLLLMSFILGNKLSGAAVAGRRVA